MSVYEREAGLTLVEVLVALSLFLVAVLMFGSSLSAIQRMQVTSSAYSRANDQVQLAFQEIDREIRSGYVANVLGPAPFPAPPSGSDWAVKLFTQARGVAQCVMWALGPVGSPIKTLYRTSWDANGGSPPTSLSSSGWRLVATDLWNFVAPNSVTPFVVLTGGSGVLPLLQVDFLINAQSRAEAAVRVTSTFTSRNVPRQGEQVVGAATGTTAGNVC